MLREWVKDGGGLVILGGLVTLGQNWNMQRGWPEFLPVELNMPWEIRRCSPSVKFAKPVEGSPLAGVGWDEPPAVFYRHVVKTTPEAVVLLEGDRREPLLVGGPYGKGRVVVFTGTVLGEAPDGEAAFWETTCWPEVLAGAMRWSSGRN